MFIFKKTSRTCQPSRFFFLIAFGFLTSLPFASAQNTGYHPLPIKSKQEARLLREIQKNHEKNLSKLGSLPSEHQDIYEEFYVGRLNFLEERIKDGHLLFDDSLQLFFDNIAAEIFRANPEIQSDKIRIFIDRSDLPNALSLGDGSIIFNLGLLSRLESESQIAFILCHEIAHFYLEHAEFSLRQQAAALTNKTTKREIKKISKMEYGGREKAIEPLQTIVYENRRHSRSHESQADSMAMAWLLKTRFDASAADRVLEILDRIDEEKYPDSIDFKILFHFDGFPFKERWLKREAVMFDGEMGGIGSAFHQDSIKTHPDCTLRRELLKPGSDQNTTQFTGDDSDDISYWVYVADFEIVQGLFDLGYTGEALYCSLKLLKKYPDEPYLHGMTGICLAEIFLAMEEHRLEEIVSYPAPSQPFPYKRFLEFIHNLRLSEVGQLAWYYMEGKNGKVKANEEFHFALALAAKVAQKEEAYKKYKRQYLETYPLGRYRKSLISH